MSDPTNDEAASPREDDEGQAGPLDSDDTTQADAGMVGGTGTDESQATVDPLGTEAHDEDEPQGED